MTNLIELNNFVFTNLRDMTVIEALVADKIIPKQIEVEEFWKTSDMPLVPKFAVPKWTT